MSWDSYTTTLVNSGKVKSAAIFGLDGQVWAQSAGLSLLGPETLAIIHGFKGDAGKETVARAGAVVGGLKYMYIMSDESVMNLRKGTCGVAIFKTNQCYVLGTYDANENQSAGNCQVELNRIAEYLKGQGY